jgi:hypothetical protein
MERFEAAIVLVRGRVRTNQSFVAAHEHDQCASKINGKQGHCDRGHNTPHYERMPFPLPNFMKQAYRMMAEMFNLVAVERQTARVK